MARADWSLYDALSCASIAVLQAKDGNGVKAEEAWMEASIAGLTAFPEGSPEAAAMSVVLAAVGRNARAVKA
jgi:hypothetical protein